MRDLGAGKRICGGGASGGAGTTTVACNLAMEFAQLTGLPAHLASQHIILRLILGACFSIWDLPAYAVGTAFGAGIHFLLRRGPLKAG